MGRILAFAAAAIATIALASPVAGSGCALEILRPDPASSRFLLIGSGFGLGEDVTFEMSLEGQAVLPPPGQPADPEGSVSDSITMESGDPQGRYTVRATAESCSAEATFTWALPDTATAALLPTMPASLAPIIVLLAGALTCAYFLRRPISSATPHLVTRVESACDSRIGSSSVGQRETGATLSTQILLAMGVIGVLLAVAISLVRWRTQK